MPALLRISTTLALSLGPPENDSGISVVSKPAASAINLYWAPGLRETLKLSPPLPTTTGGLWSSTSLTTASAGSVATVTVTSRTRSVTGKLIGWPAATETSCSDGR